MSLAAIDHAPSTYQGQILWQSAAFYVVDCFSDPYGWSVNPHQASPSNANIKQPTVDAPLSLFASKTDGLALLESHLTGDGALLGGKQVHVFLDGATTLVDVFGVEAICQFLNKLRKNPKVASLTFHIHSDLHSEHDVSLLCHNLKCLVTLYQGAQFERNRLSGRIEIMTRRKTSGPKRDLYDYVLHAESGLSLSPVANSKPGAEPFQPFQQQLPGGMRLELTEPEAAARKHVQLPYEHQGQGSVYSSRDFREYLPETAGGKSARLGHILYVRDSDSEEPDSDEDPDDDLDI